MTEVRAAQDCDIEILSVHDKHIKQEDLCAAIQQNRVYIIEENGAFAGWLRYNLFWDSIPFMNMLFLLDGMRGKGYGRRLVEKWEKEMGERGYETVMTSTQSNEHAQHFYMHLGYKAIGGFTLKDDPYEIVMSKQIK